MVGKKPKFQLTSDLINIEQESEVMKVSEPKKKKKTVIKEQLNIKISKQLKQSFQVWCVQNSVNMSECIETLIEEKLKN
ncbi:MAG: hypothetical protein Q8K36_05425 [Alphaproteobacteria bacterium]|nr:hypothetical protein [Alphaproteobacteria bacterium]